MLMIPTSDNGFESNGGHRRQPGKVRPPLGELVHLY